MLFAVALVFAFATLAVIGRVGNLRMLAGSIAAVHAFTLTVEPAYASWIAVEVAIVICAMAFWCSASSAVAKLSIIAGIIHGAMLLWSQSPVPYGWFMVAYHTYGPVIRFIELAQLAVVVWWLPQVQGILPESRRSRGKEPPKWYGQEYSPQH